MLGRRSEQRSVTLRVGQDRLRLRPWGSDARTGMLILLTSGRAASDAAVAASVESAATQGYLRIRTSAVSLIEAEPFLRAGFEPGEQLALLCRPIKPRLPQQSNALAIRRARRRHQNSVLALDQAAFEPFWWLGKTGLREALRAAPFRRFRIAYQPSGAATAGYAISGRSGPAGYLQRLAISPRQQGRGVGTALVIDSLRWMARWGTAQAWVNTPHSNTAALALYERLGFDQVAPGLQVLEMDLAV